jgi:hypothetical protein
MRNMLLSDVTYQTRTTPLGTWREFVYENGARFAEFRSHAVLAGWPLLHVTSGICPETGKRVIAKGVIAIGRIAVGLLAVGQASAGVFAIGQASLGLFAALGQACAGWYCVGQLACGVAFGLGQLATGATAIGQLAAGEYVLAQVAWGSHVWTPSHADPAAVSHFRALLQSIRTFF